MISVPSSITRCPQCQADRPEEAEECIRCGAGFAKYRPASTRANAAAPAKLSTSSSWVGVTKRWLIDSDTTADLITFCGRAVMFMTLVWWGCRFIVTPLETNYAGESVLHLINLPFHEAGHLIFMPFGQFMMFLGGSAAQILMPVICLGTFLVKTRDPFGASVCLWWTAENFMDIAPYIADARAMDLVLLGGATGKETEGHDWNNLLATLGWLEHDHRLAHLSQDVGIGLMILSFVWGGWLLLAHYRRLST